MFKKETKVHIFLLLLVVGLAFWLPGQAQAACGDAALNTIAGPFKVNDGFCDINSAIRQIIYWVLSIVGMVAALMLVWGGFQYMTAGGDDSAVKKARQRMTNAVIGLAIVLFAYIIVAITVNVLTSVSPTGGGGSTSGTGTGGSGTGGQQQGDPQVRARENAMRRIKEGVVVQLTGNGGASSVFAVRFQGNADDLRQFCPQAQGNLLISTEASVEYLDDNADIEDVYFTKAANKELTAVSLPAGISTYDTKVSGTADHAIIPTQQGTGEYSIALENVRITLKPEFRFTATDYTGECTVPVGDIITTADKLLRP